MDIISDLDLVMVYPFENRKVCSGYFTRCIFYSLVVLIQRSLKNYERFEFECFDREEILMKEGSIFGMVAFPSKIEEMVKSVHKEVIFS